MDQPLQLLTDSESGKDFLGCDYNRDGDSFRYAHRLVERGTKLIGIGHLGQMLISPKALVLPLLPLN